MDPTFDLLAHAIKHHDAGRFAQAEALCREMLEREPAHAGALHVLGVVALHSGRLDPAVQYLEQALSIAPGAAEIHNSLAAVLRAKGYANQSETHCRQALALNPRLAEAHCNMGALHLDAQRFPEAIEAYDTALTLQSGLVDARLNLATTLRRTGRSLDALRVLFEGIDLDPSNSRLRSTLGEALRGFALSAAGGRERTVLASMCGDDRVSMMHLSLSVLGLLRNTPALAKLLVVARAGADPSAAPAEAREFARDPLLLAALPNMVMHDAQIELVLTAIRRSILLAVRENTQSDAAVFPFEFECALARQCFFSEYALYVPADEGLALKWVESRIQSALRKPIGNPRALEPLLVAAAMYGPLSRFAGWTRLLGPLTTSWSEPFRPLLNEQLLHRRREKEIESNLAVITPITDEVSKAVRQQYEDNPYPLWVSAGSPQPMTVAEFVRPLGDGTVMAPLPSPAPILVAGCGTGHHPIEVARKFRDCEILALDLSRASLAYAGRMAEKLQISNITFQQADILELGTLDRRFAVIECGGVLHHLRDPLAGWRVLSGLLLPGGLMKVALYSKAARRRLQAARDFARDERFEPNPEGIRRLRRAILDRPEGDPVRDALRFGDFYSLNGCRDLLMHVQEHQLTLPQIAAYLEALGLAFVSMEVDDEVQARFRELRAQPGAPADLALWDRIEQSDPDVFRNMYQFWCRAKST